MTDKTKKNHKQASFIKKIITAIKNLFPSFKEIKDAKFSFAAAILSGILYILILPKTSLSFLGWITLVPLIFSIKDKNPKLSFYLGLTFGFMAFYGSLFWINYIRKYNPYAVIGIPFMCLYIALYPAVFSMTFVYMNKHIRKFHFLIAACLWTALEYIRSLGRISLPFGLFAASQVDSVTLLQICDFTGIFGVSFVLALTNIFIANAIFYFRKKDFKNIPLEIGVLSAVLIFTFVYGNIRLKESFVNENKKISIGVVQPSIPQEIKFKSYADDNEDVKKQLQQEINNKQFALLKSKKNSGINLFILPESAFTNELFAYDLDFQKMLHGLSKEIDADMFFGADKLVMLDRKGKITQNRDEYFGTGAFNSAWFLSKENGLNPESYDKIHLLPFGEYVPYFDKIPYFQEIIVQVGSFLEGKVFSVFESNGVRFGSVICIESIYGNLVRHFRKSGADFLVVITNDAWYADTAGPIQHSDFCTFRAIENRTWLVRCANHGVSGFITPHGVWKSKLGINEVGVLTEDINPAKKTISFYSKHGDLFSQIILLISLLSIAFCFFKNHLGKL